jgi:hypothetical protein
VSAERQTRTGTRNRNYKPGDNLRRNPRTTELKMT